MERALYVWLEDNAQKWLSVSDDVGEGEDHASRGWFANLILSPRTLHSRSSLFLIMLQGICKILIMLLNDQAENLSNTTTSILQLFNQEIIVTFQRDYTYCTFQIILYASEKETFVNVSACWKQ